MSNNETVSKIMPQNIEAEQAVLGIMFNGGDYAVRAMDILSSNDFYQENHRIIFETIGFLMADGENVDLLTVSNRLEKEGKIEKVGNYSYIASLISSVPSFRGIESYAKIVREKAILRNIIRAGQTIINASYSEKDASEIAKLLVEMEEDVTRYSDKTKGRKIEVKEVIDELLQEIVDFESGKKKVFPTGFESLDKLVSSFIIPNIWIIGGYTGTGKTFFTLNLLINLMRKGAKVILYSTENNSTRNVLRLLGCMTGFSEMKIYKGKFTDEEMQRLKAARKELATFNLIIYDTVFDTDGIWLKTKKHKIEDRADLIVIDYIQNINQAKSNGEIYRQMSHVALELQRMAIQLNIGVIGVSQVSNAEVEKRDNKTMTFKGAGEISAISDVAIWLRRSANNKNLLYAFLKKVRHGISGERVMFEFFSEKLLTSGKYIDELKEGEDNDN